MAAEGEFPKLLLSVSFFHFFFLRNSSCSVLLLHTRKGLSSHTAHLSSYTRDCPGQGPTWPNSQLSPASVQGLCGFTTRPYSPPCDFKQPGLSWCCSNLVWQGRQLLTQLSPRSFAAGLVGMGLGLQLPWSPWDLSVLKQSPHHLFFQCPLYFLVSYLHKRWGCWLFTLFLSRSARCFNHVPHTIMIIWEKKPT